MKLYLLITMLLLVACSHTETVKTPEKPTTEVVTDPATLPVEDAVVLDQTVLDPEQTPEVVVVPGGTVLVDQPTIPNSSEGKIEIETVPGQVKEQSTFAVKSDLKWVADAAKVAECVIRNEDFLKEVANHPQFTYTTKTSKQVSDSMRRFVPSVITTYKKRFTSTIAYRNVGSNVVYLNLAKNPRPIKELVNTLIHENLHCRDWGHPSNRTATRPESVPYKVGLIAEKYANGECSKEILK